MRGSLSAPAGNHVWFSAEVNSLSTRSEHSELDAIARLFLSDYNLFDDGSGLSYGKITVIQ